MDVAEGAIEGARKAAQDAGLDGLTYEVADLNTAKLPKETYDAVYVHAALHHVFQLEHLLDQIKQTLKPGGLFVVYEYIGPAQMQFPRRDLELADAFLNAIPERYRSMPLTDFSSIYGSSQWTTSIKFDFVHKIKAAPWMRTAFPPVSNSERFQGHEHPRFCWHRG